MSQLTEKQQLVFNIILAGAILLDDLIKETKMTKSSLSPVLTSLINKNLIAKNEDNTYTAIQEEKGNKEEEDSDSMYSLPSNKIDLVIPYLKSEAAGEELRYALRSWEKNFTEDIRVIIVGDREDWFSPEIVHIPHEPHLIKEVCACPNPALIRNPQADVAHKIFTAITVENISGGFIVSNDDIFLLGETTLADIESLKAFAHDLVKTGDRKGLYAQNNKLAAQALLANGLPTIRYGTHTPMAFHAEKLLEVIEKYNATEHGYPLASLFYNEVFPNARPILIDGGANDPILASAYRSDIDPIVLEKVFNTRKFLNCDSKGWKSIEKIIKKTFSTPSKFEK